MGAIPRAVQESSQPVFVPERVALLVGAKVCAKIVRHFLQIIIRGFHALRDHVVDDLVPFLPGVPLPRKGVRAMTCRAQPLGGVETITRR